MTCARIEIKLDNLGLDIISALVILGNNRFQTLSHFGKSIDTTLIEVFGLLLHDTAY